MEYRDLVSQILWHFLEEVGMDVQLMRDPRYPTARDEAWKEYQDIESDLRKERDWTEPEQ